MCVCVRVCVTSCLLFDLLLVCVCVIAWLFVCLCVVGLLVCVVFARGSVCLFVDVPIVRLSVCLIVFLFCEMLLCCGGWGLCWYG